MWNFGWQEGWFFLFAIGMNLLFWGGLVLLIVWGVRQFRPAQPPPPSGTGPLPPHGGDDAMRILEERYARGEIDDREFQQRRDVLRANRGT